MNVCSILNHSRTRDSFSQGASSSIWLLVAENRRTCKFRRRPGSHAVDPSANGICYWSSHDSKCSGFTRPPSSPVTDPYRCNAKERFSAEKIHEQEDASRRDASVGIEQDENRGPDDLLISMEAIQSVLPRTHALVGLSIRKMRDRKFSRTRKNARPRSRAGENRRVLKHAETCVSLPRSPISWINVCLTSLFMQDKLTFDKSRIAHSESIAIAIALSRTRASILSSILG
jgi:hypothetical protein